MDSSADDTNTEKPCIIYTLVFDVAEREYTSVALAHDCSGCGYMRAWCTRKRMRGASTIVHYTSSFDDH